MQSKPAFLMSLKPTGVSCLGVILCSKKSSIRSREILASERICLNHSKKKSWSVLLLLLVSRISHI